MKNNTMVVFLLTLFFNMVVSYYIGYKYKAYLDGLLSSPIYYQAVVFISLTLPLIISGVFGFFSKYITLWRISRFKKKDIDISKFDDSTQEMYQAIVEQDIPTKAQIKEMYQALNDQYK